jgi:hypothetical protein
MKLANCHRCGTQGKTVKNNFTGDTYFAFCPQCRYFIEGVTRDDAIREWNDLNATRKESLQVEPVGDSD